MTPSDPQQQPERLTLLHTDLNAPTVGVEQIIALLPAILWAIFQHGITAVIHILFSVIFTLILDLIRQIILLLTERRKTLAVDPAILLIGTLIALALPCRASLWVIFAADFVAIAVGRMLLRSIVPPVALGCSFALLITKGFSALAAENPTPLDQLLAGISPDEGSLDLFLGRAESELGTASCLLLLLGGLYLIFRRHISWEVPATMLVGAGVAASLLTPESVAYNTYLMGQLFTGGLIFSAFFIAATPATAPLTSIGRLIYGLLIGVITLLLRTFGRFDGVYPAILICSAIVPLIDRLTMPAMFGGNPKHDPTLPSKN